MARREYCSKSTINCCISQDVTLVQRAPARSLILLLAGWPNSVVPFLESDQRHEIKRKNSCKQRAASKKIHKWSGHIDLGGTGKIVFTKLSNVLENVREHVKRIACSKWSYFCSAIMTNACSSFSIHRDWSKKG